MKKKLLEKSRLYIIADNAALKKISAYQAAARIKNSGVDIIQLRAKCLKKEDSLSEALKLRKLLSGTGIIFIVNDYIDIAKISDADGIHLGQSDTSIGIARKILGENKIIGVSCHSLKQAIAAQNKGADYISIGPVFRTPTKPEYKPVGLKLLKAVSKKIKIPFFAIGGINKDTIREVLSYGAKRVAVCGAVCAAKNMASSASYLEKILH